MTYIYSGAIRLAKSPGATAVRNITVGDGGHFASLWIEKGDQIEDSAKVRLNSGIGNSLRTELNLGERHKGGFHEYFDTLGIEGYSVMSFYGGTLANPDKLLIRNLLIDATKGQLLIKNWIEYADFFLVSRLYAPSSATLAKITFEGWAPGAELRDYDATYLEIIPYGAPEPVLTGALLGAVGLGLWQWKKRKQRRVASDTHADATGCSLRTRFTDYVGLRSVSASK